MEIYHKNKDQHDKGLSDEVLKDLLELQRINKIEPKKMDQITDVSSLFKYDMEMRIGDKMVLCQEKVQIKYNQFSLFM